VAGFFEEFVGVQFGSGGVGGHRDAVPMKRDGVGRGGLPKTVPLIPPKRQSHHAALMLQIATFRLGVTKFGNPSSPR